jgi:mitochondrial cardiolipin hydrolase
MERHELEKLLHQSLDDGRLSRNERRVFEELLAQGELSQSDLLWLRSLAFDLARERAPGQQYIFDWLDRILLSIHKHSLLARKDSLPRQEVLFSPGDECWQKLVELFEGAKGRVEVCVFTITDNRIVRAMLACQQRGVRIRVISDDEKANDLGSDIDALQAAGIPVRMDNDPNHMHHKYAIFDQEVVVTGSYNWTRSAAQGNEENIVLLPDQSILCRFQHHFEELWTQLRL